MIEIKDISKAYGNIKAVDGVSFSVSRGELFGLVGPDGAGKTTLFRLLTTLLLPDRGSAIIDGLNIVKDYGELRKHLGYMPGHFSLYPDLSIEENLNFFATLFGTTVKANYDTIAPIYRQIEPFKKRAAGKLSGGMKQKLALCCALIHKPMVLCLDEPTTGVDPVSRQEFWEMLHLLKQMGITIVVSTPYRDEIMQCDRVAYINKGKIESIGKPEDMIDNYFKDSILKDSSIKKTFEPIIKIENLTKKFGHFTAVDHISFQVNRGEIFGFLGANGAGKTTAMKMLCGLSIPTSGSGTIVGCDVMKDSELIKRKIGYMSQRFSLYDDLKVWENIRLFGGIYGMSDKDIKEKTDRLLKNLKLENQRDTLVGSLPLGWKQKLAFSVAIFHHPDVVFLDEPTGGVDPTTRGIFWQLIYKAASDGITIFVTTHYMEEAEYCSRVSIMVEGKIKALDTPSKLKEQYHVTSMQEVFLKLCRPTK